MTTERPVEPRAPAIGALPGARVQRPPGRCTSWWSTAELAVLLERLSASAAATEHAGGTVPPSIEAAIDAVVAELAKRRA